MGVHIFVSRMTERLHDLSLLENNLNHLHRLISDVMVLEGTLPEGLSKK